jgi:GntR family transcriptional regulator, transcriptional repressor for pyruvate dehydrogenase complex
MGEENGTGFRVVQKRRASQSIVAQVQELLVSGRIRPGDRLPSEREMAEALQVARTTVREAYRTLEVLGLISVRPGIGTVLVERSTLDDPVAARNLPAPAS